MEFIVNEPFLEKRGKWAKWASYAGFAALFGGLLLSSRSLIASYALLLLGLIAASIGSYLANRYVREPRPDKALAEAMESLDKRYVLYSYHLPSNHIVISHFGLTILDPLAHAGQITFDNGRWRHRAGIRKVMQFFGEPALGKPHQDMAKEVEWINEWIDEVLPKEDIPVSGVLVFTNPKATLEARDKSIAVVTAEGLPRHMKEGLKGGTVLPTTTQKLLRRTMDELIAQG